MYQHKRSLAVERSLVTESHWRFITTIALVALIALVSVPSFASARHKTYGKWYSQKPQTSTPVVTPAPTIPTPAPTPAPTTPPPAAPPTLPVATPPAAVPAATGTFCMNLGYQTRVNGKYDWAQVDSNFAKLKASGVNCVRLDYGAFHDANIESLGLRGKSNGLFIIIGGTWGTLDSSQLATYDAGVIAQAKWAELNKMPQMSIGNEQESRLSGITPAQWAQHLLVLASQVRQVYSGKISYEINSDNLPLWQQNGLGAIDLLGLNVYCGVGCNSDRIAAAIKSFGATHVYVSETNSDMETGLYNSDQVHATNVQNNFLVLRSKFPTIPMYYYRFLASGTSPGEWGLYNGTAIVAPLTAAVLGIK